MNLALIGIVRRGVPLAQRIAQAMRGIDRRRSSGGRAGHHTVPRRPFESGADGGTAFLGHSFGVDNMDLVLIDDVLYTGRTIRAAMNGLFDLGRPKRVSLCVLIDPWAPRNAIEAQFIGRHVQTSDTEIIEVRLGRLTRKSESCWSTAWSRFAGFSQFAWFHIREGTLSYNFRDLLALEPLTADELSFLLDQSNLSRKFRKHR